jgi:hypothetical protein
MAEELTFELFCDSDAPAVADLLNRNHFYLSEHKKITAEDYRYVQKHRGVAFSVLAKKRGTVVGMAAAYYNSGQKVTKPHQIFMGTMLLDIKYRLSYAVLVGLYDRLIKELSAHGYAEILAEVSYENTQSLYVVLKYGFVLLYDKADRFGYLMLHNYFLALMNFLGTGEEGISTSEFFANLPIVNKRDARTAKTLLHDRYIEEEYRFDGKQLLLLIDTRNLKVDGVDFSKHFKLYPDFERPGCYLLRNQQNSDELRLSMEISEACEGVEKTSSISVSLAPGENRLLEFSPQTERAAITLGEDRYFLFPNKTQEQTTDTFLEKKYPGFSMRVSRLTGLISIVSTEDTDELIRMPWPCAAPPYIEGAVASRHKVLTIEGDDERDGAPDAPRTQDARDGAPDAPSAQDAHADGRVIITENTEHFCLVRVCSFENDHLSIETTLRRKSRELDFKPLSHLWVEKTPESCVLRSRDDQIVLDSNAVANSFKSCFEDYAFWDPSDTPGLLTRGITLDFSTYALTISLDDDCVPINHFPNFEFFLRLDDDQVLEEQSIEQIEIHYQRKDSPC